MVTLEPKSKYFCNAISLVRFHVQLLNSLLEVYRDGVWAHLIVFCVLQDVVQNFIIPTKLSFIFYSFENLSNLTIIIIIIIIHYPLSIIHYPLSIIYYLLSIIVIIIIITVKNGLRKKHIFF